MKKLKNTKTDINKSTNYSSFNGFSYYQSSESSLSSSNPIEQSSVQQTVGRQEGHRHSHLLMSFGGQQQLSLLGGWFVDLECWFFLGFVVGWFGLGWFVESFLLFLFLLIEFVWLLAWLQLFGWISCFVGWIAERFVGRLVWLQWFDFEWLVECFDSVECFNRTRYQRTTHSSIQFSGHSHYQNSSLPSCCCPKRPHSPHFLPSDWNSLPLHHQYSPSQLYHPSSMFGSCHHSRQECLWRSFVGSGWIECYVFACFWLIGFAGWLMVEFYWFRLVWSLARGSC